MANTETSGLGDIRSEWQEALRNFERTMEDDVHLQLEGEKEKMKKDVRLQVESAKKVIEEDIRLQLESEKEKIKEDVRLQVESATKSIKEDIRMELEGAKEFMEEEMRVEIEMANIQLKNGLRQVVELDHILTGQSIRRQLQDAKELMQEDVRLQAESVKGLMHDTLRQQEEERKYQETQLKTSLKRLKERVANLEMQPYSPQGWQSLEGAGKQSSMALLERGMAKMTTAVGEASDTVPHSGAEEAHLERCWPPRTPPARVSTPFSKTLSNTSNNTMPSSILAPVSLASGCLPAVEYKSQSATSPASSWPPPSTIPGIHQRALGEELMEAVKCGRVDIVRRLLKRGNVNYANEMRETPLMRASDQGDESMMYVLLNRGADVQATSSLQMTPLHFAAAKDYSGKGVALLLSAGACLNACDNNGWTPLHMAAMSENQAAALMLLAAGASKTAEDNLEMLPFELASTEVLREALRP